LRTRIFTLIVLGLLLGNVFIGISQNTEAKNTENNMYDSDTVPNDVISADTKEIVNFSPINRRLTIYEEKSSSPVLVSGEDDVLHMAWIDSRTIYPNSTTEYTTIFYKQSYDYGNTWTSDTPLSTRITEATSIDLAIDDNYLAIAWEEGNDVFTMFSYDNGNSWTEPYQINSVRSPSIALKGNDVFLVFKTRPQVGDPYLSGKKLTIGPELQTPVTYDFNPAGNNQIASIGDVTVDDNLVHVAIKDQMNTQLHYYSSDDNGTTWSGGIIGNSFGEDVLGSVKIANKDNSINIVWSDNRDGDYNLYMKSSDDYGQTWNPEIKIIETSGKSTNIDVVLNSESEINMCWEEVSETGNQIFYSMLDKDINEQSIISITDGSSTASKPTIAVDSNDYFYALWQDDRDENNEIYFSTNLGVFDKQIDYIIEYIDSMPDEHFSKKAEQQKNTLNNKLEAVRTQLEQEAYMGALNKLENDVLKKIDSWIIDNTAQEELMGMISGLITGIELYTSPTEPIGGSEWCDIGTAMDTLVQPGGGLRRHPYEWSGIYTSGSRTYRLGDNYCNFWLDIENQNWAKNIDYRITFVFMASAQIEVKQLSGPSWTNYESIGKLPGNGNWRTYSLETNYLWNYDASTANSNCNILFEFESIILLDSITVIPVEYHCDVGESGDNSLAEHDPGVCVYPNTEWGSPTTIDTLSCKLGGDYSNIYLNSPDNQKEYRIEVRYKSQILTTDGGFRQWTGSQYQSLGTYKCDKEWHTSIFITNKDWYYDYYGNANKNVLFEFTKAIYLDYIKLTVARDYCDVGTTGDDVATNHEPGISVYPAEWNSPSTEDGRTVRWGPSYCNLYLNDIDTSKDYVIKITYKSPAGSDGKFRQWDGNSYRTLGKYIADNNWQTTTFIAKSFWVYDYNGGGHTYSMDALFEFSKGLWVDEIKVGVMEKYAILLAGGTDCIPAFENDLYDVYDNLKDYEGWKDENIDCYLWNQPSTYNWRVDGKATRANMEKSFIELGLKITEDDFFMFVEICHALKVGNVKKPIFLLYSPGGYDTVNIYDDTGQTSLKTFLNRHITGKQPRTLVILQSCWSGIGTTQLDLNNRIIMTAGDNDDYVCTTPFEQNWEFIHTYSNNVGNRNSPNNLYYAFEKAYNRCSGLLYGRHYPQINDATLAIYTWY